MVEGMTARLAQAGAPHDTKVSFSAPLPLAVSDRHKVASLKAIPDLQQFLWDESELRSLKLCSRFYRCNKPLCPECSTRRATDARQRLAPTAHAHASVLFLRLSVVSCSDLESGWQSLEAVRREFVARRYLTSRCDGWYVQREITRTKWAWNVHLNFLIFDGDDTRLQALRRDAIPHWLKAAHKLGMTASGTGQHSEIWQNPRKAVAYAVKGIMHQKADRDPLRDGYSPGDLLALYHSGDADAADAWHELETFLKAGRRRWFDRGGDLRGKKSNFDLAA